MKAIINPEQIVRVYQGNPKHMKEYYYRRKKEFRIFGWLISSVREGWYDKYGYHFISNEDVEEKYFVNKSYKLHTWLFTKRSVTICFSSGYADDLTFYFDSEDCRIEFLRRLIKEANLTEFELTENGYITIN